MAAARITLKAAAKMIDHSLLRPELKQEEIIAGCQLAAKYDVASVCVRPCDVSLAAKELKGTVRWR